MIFETNKLIIKSSYFEIIIKIKIFINYLEILK